LAASVSRKADEAVADELLGPHHDEFAEALRELEGQCEYVVKGRYVEQAILHEVLGEQPQAAQLTEQIKGADPNVTVDVLEDRRIPSSTDLLATYQIELDLDGELLSYRRLRRCARGRGDYDGEA